jgi:pyruvate formate lyase activating enzyme
VLETIRYIHRETTVWMELTTLLIPGANDDPGEIEAMSRWIRSELGPDVPLHFTAFHPDYKMMDVPATPLSTLRRAREIALAHGLRYVYTGNVRDVAGETTRCPGCGFGVIVRAGYQITDWNLEAAGRCAGCGLPVAGVFDGPPGHWGARRLPVRLELDG